ncbi:dna-directed rna polymerase i rpa1 [Cystoisospora suis]|uniref:Dna-directed rna polymerase i rpa1 n=1 Tax=Cystoisospora suis TaxID=483139 RepID=A0A2C6KGS4_9APIC|nr:dna-directed rna polymerase i rpa1 [Cystoisospora suis]
MSYETSFKFLTEACERAAVDALSTPSASLVVGSPSPIGSQQLQVYTQLRPSLHKQRDYFIKRTEVGRADRTTVSFEVEGEEVFSRKKRKDRKAVNSGGEPGGACVVFSRAEEGLLSGSKKTQQPRLTDGKSSLIKVGRAEADPENNLKAPGMIVRETEMDEEIISIEKEKARKHSSKKKRTFDFV